MSFKYQDEIDMNLFASILKDAVSKVKTEEDPEVLTDLKKQFKKNVPFTLRMYVAAYLAKQAMTGRTGAAAKIVIHATLQEIGKAAKQEAVFLQSLPTQLLKAQNQKKPKHVHQELK